jgi:hypothetical protein
MTFSRHIEYRQFAAGVIRGRKNYRMIPGARKDADALLKDGRRVGSQIRQRIRMNIGYLLAKCKTKALRRAGAL